MPFVEDSENRLFDLQFFYLDMCGDVAFFVKPSHKSVYKRQVSADRFRALAIFSPGDNQVIENILGEFGGVP